MMPLARIQSQADLTPNCPLAAYSSLSWSVHFNRSFSGRSDAEPRKVPCKLQPSDDDARRYPLFSGKTLDVQGAQSPGHQQELFRRMISLKQEVRCPVVRLSLILILTVLVSVNEYTPLAVQKDVCGFMQQTKLDLLV